MTARGEMKFALYRYTCTDLKLDRAACSLLALPRVIHAPLFRTGQRIVVGRSVIG